MRLGQRKGTERKKCEKGEWYNVLMYGMHVYIYIYIYTYLHINIYICVYICIHTHTHTYTYVYTYVYTHTHTYTYIYIYIYIYIYTYNTRDTQLVWGGVKSMCTRAIGRTLTEHQGNNLHRTSSNATDRQAISDIKI